MIENTIEFWNTSWQMHMATYFSTPPRTGIFIKKFLNKKIKSIIEIACGSSRDSIYLAKSGYNVVASDFNVNILNELKKKFIHDNLVYQLADANFLPYDDNHFDLVFHNGFFVLFKDNKKIIQFLVEQHRVSKRFILFFVHNALNVDLKKKFEEKAQCDSLYDVRFFSPDELINIIEKSDIKKKKVILKKFGGFADLFYNKYIHDNIPNFLFPIKDDIIPCLYQFQRWKKTERIACLIEIDI